MVHRRTYVDQIYAFTMIFFISLKRLYYEVYLLLFRIFIL